MTNETNKVIIAMIGNQYKTTDYHAALVSEEEGIQLDAELEALLILREQRFDEYLKKERTME